jgi:hypothetical protein
MAGPIAAYQLRRFDPALADGPVAELIGGDTESWQTHTAYPLNSDMLVCGPLAIVAVNSRAGTTSVYWRGEMHAFGTGNANDALRRFWNVPEYQPRPKPKPVAESY